MVNWKLPVEIEARDLEELTFHIPQFEIRLPNIFKSNLIIYLFFQMDWKIAEVILILIHETKYNYI